MRIKLFRKNPTTFNQRMEELGKLLARRRKLNHQHPKTNPPTVWDFEEE